MSDLSLFIGRMMPLFDEKERRLFLGSLIEFLGHGSLKKVQELTGISHVTLIAGKKEAQSLEVDPKAKPKVGEGRHVRQEGAGRKSSTDKYPQIKEVLLGLLDGNVKGNPENPLCWTTKSLRNLEEGLSAVGIKVSYVTVKQLLEELGFSLQQNKKSNETVVPNPDRESQFRFINRLSKDFLRDNQPVISVDTKKKEIDGNNENNGSGSSKKHSSILVLNHDLPDEKGNDCPYGIYDINRNEGFVHVGISDDTGEFAVNSIRSWWKMMGKEKYPKATKILIMADDGGSDERRNKLWKNCLQDIATESQLEIHVSHFPAGTTRWNKIEHRMFCFISKNWRGKPFRTLATIVTLIAPTRTGEGINLSDNAVSNAYEKCNPADTEALSSSTLKDCHSNWNYVIYPRQLLLPR